MRVFTYLVWVSIERIQSHSPSIRFCAVWLGGMYNVILLLTHSSANRKNKHRPTKNMFSLNCIAVCVWKSSRDENIYVSISSFARHANVHAQMNLSLQFLGRIQNRQFKSNYEMRISTSNKLMKQFAKDWNREREREEKKKWWLLFELDENIEWNYGLMKFLFALYAQTCNMSVFICTLCSFINLMGV